jgi:chromobox protein 5
LPRGAKELIADYWSRNKKGDKTGRKSDPKPRVATRRPAVLSVESTPERHVPKKRGRGRPKAKLDSDDESAEEKEDTRSRKKSRKSNGATRKASPSPASSSETASPIVELLEPSAIKKWGTLPSWERLVETIDTVERTEEGDLFIYFKLYVYRRFACTLSDSLGMLFVGRARKQHARKLRESVRKSFHKRCALSRSFNLHDLSRLRI